MWQTQVTGIRTTPRSNLLHEHRILLSGVELYPADIAVMLWQGHSSDDDVCRRSESQRTSLARAVWCESSYCGVTCMWLQGTLSARS